MEATHTAEDVRAPGFRLGRLFGVELRLDWSLLLIFALIVFNLGAGLFPAWHPDWPRAVSWLTATAAAALFLVSILVHELSHALAGRAMGTPVHGITLFLFGGMARMCGEPRSPGAEFVIAIVGPLTSLVIGVGASIAGYAMLGAGMAGPDDLDLIMREAGPVSTLLVWLGPVNVALALFNLLPGFPLDGGRVLRSIFWASTRDFVKATRWAAMGGQLFGGLLVALGVVNALSGRVGNGLWLMLIGWFLGSAARSSLLQVLLKQSLADLPVTAVMRTRFDCIAPELSVGELVREHLLKTDQRAWPVESGGELRGLVVWNDVRRVPQHLWEATPVTVIMTPRERLAILGDDAQAEDALELMTRHDVDQVPVMKGDALAGVVRRSDLLKWLALKPHEQHKGPPHLTPLHH